MARKVLPLLFLLLVVTGALFAQEPQSDFKVVAHWTMRNTGASLVEDVSGNGHHGTLVGETAFNDDPDMMSAEITGHSGYISVPHHDDLEPARGGVELWVKPAYLRDADMFTKLTFYTIRTGQQGGKQVFGVHLLADGNVAGYILNDGGNPDWRIWTWVRSVHPVISARSWHHLVLQWDGLQVTLYVDGKKIARRGYKEVPELGLSYSRESAFTLGQATRWYGNDDHQFIGQYGETRIYHGTLTEEEIRQRASRFIE